MEWTNFLYLILVGLLAGIVSGVAGIGGGIIVVPALVFLMGFTQHQAQGTSLAMMILPIGILAVIQYYKGGHINVKYALVLAAAFFVGGYFGSRIAVPMPEHILKKVFGVILALASIRMLFWK